MPAPALAARRVPGEPNRPGYLHHPHFDRGSAAGEFSPAPPAAADSEPAYMPDETTRDLARRMHYAAHRLRTTHRRSWHAAYLGLRDRIVLGNRKLIYRAVRSRMANHPHADDLIGECHIVLIHAVAAFNPWLDVRFSTYAYTCLIRALSRSSQKLAADRLTQALSLDALRDGEPCQRGWREPPSSANAFRLEEFLHDDHPLLSEREKAILARRFAFEGESAEQTLEQVGRAVGLSKERVRQVQLTAICKIRAALAYSKLSFAQ